MGRRRRGGRRANQAESRNDLHGVLVVDKPSGLVSMRVVERVRRLVKVSRAGHAGTLDPAATGILPVCIGHATRISSLILGEEKEYEATVVLGLETNTGDLDGEVTRESEPPDATILSRDSALLADVLGQLTGNITQRPPAYSAIRVDGERLYKKARRGEDVEAPERDVVIYELEVLRCETPELDIRVRCGKGTYIRSLAMDIGAKLGCGGCLKTLRRTRVGALNLDAALTLEAIEEKAQDKTIDDAVIPMARALDHLPAATLTETGSARIKEGQLVGQDDIVETELPSTESGTMVCLLEPDGRLLALAEPRKGMLQPRRVFK